MQNDDRQKNQKPSTKPKQIIIFNEHFRVTDELYFDLIEDAFENQKKH